MGAVQIDLCRASLHSDASHVTNASSIFKQKSQWTCSRLCAFGNPLKLQSISQIHAGVQWRHYLRAVQNNLLQPPSSLNCLSHVRNASGNQIKASMPVNCVLSTSKDAHCALYH